MKMEHTEVKPILLQFFVCVYSSIIVQKAQSRLNEGISQTGNFLCMVMNNDSSKPRMKLMDNNLEKYFLLSGNIKRVGPRLLFLRQI